MSIVEAEKKGDTMKECYKCVHRELIPGSTHSSCKKRPLPEVEGKPHGIRMGWFFWPFDFDPVWLVKCDGFESKDEANKSESEVKP